MKSYLLFSLLPTSKYLDVETTESKDRSRIKTSAAHLRVCLIIACLEKRDLGSYCLCKDNTHAVATLPSITEAPDLKMLRGSSGNEGSGTSTTTTKK